MAQNILPFRKREYGCVQPAIQADISFTYACHTNQKNRYGGNFQSHVPTSKVDGYPLLKCKPHWPKQQVGQRIENPCWIRTMSTIRNPHRLLTWGPPLFFH